MEKKGVRLGCIWSAMWSIDASSYGRFFWFIVILIADVFCDVDEKVIYNVSMQTMVGMTSLTLVLCALGILSDCLTYRTDFSTEARHSLGFVHSACLPLIVFYMMTYCISTNRNMKKIGVLSFIEMGFFTALVEFFVIECVEVGFPAIYL